MKSKTWPRVLWSPLYSSVYWHAVQVTVVNFLVWMSKILVKKPPVARNSLVSKAVWPHLAHLKPLFIVIPFFVIGRYFLYYPEANPGYSPPATLEEPIMRRYLVAGNWKLNMGPAAGPRTGRRRAADLLKGRELKGDVLVCPPYVTIPAVAEVATRRSRAAGRPELRRPGRRAPTPARCRPGC